MPTIGSGPSDVSVADDKPEVAQVLYEDFAIKIEPPIGGEFPVIVLRSPSGEGRGTFRLPYCLETQLDPMLERLGHAVRSSSGTVFQGLTPARPGSEETSSEEIGSHLYEALLHGEPRDLFEHSLGGVARNPGRGLRIELHFDPEDPDLATLCGLPWELLFRRAQRQFLNLQRATPVVRYLDVPRSAGSIPVEEPFRVLVVAPEPRGMPPLNLTRERERIEEALDELRGVEVVALEAPTPTSLRRKLLEQSFHVLHFMGHGEFDPTTGAGALVFEDDDNAPRSLPGAVLARVLEVCPTLGVVFLNACDSARSSRGGLDPFSGAATALVMAGVPAVLAMQFPISDAAALAFSQAFYLRLAAGDPIDAATAEGRMAIHLHDSGSLEWATPVLFSRMPEGRVFEPTSPAVAAVAEPRGGPSDVARHVLDQSRFIADKTEGFVGREWVFCAIRQFLDDEPRGYFRIFGDPGIGKSALAAEMVRREPHVHHFNVRSEGIRRADQFLANVCAQLITKLCLEHTSLPAAATDDGLFLSSLLEEAARKQAGKKTVLVVDALDEVDATALARGVNLLYLPVTLPPGVYVIVTSRREEAPLRIECEQRILDVEQDSEGNLADVRVFVESRLHAPGIFAYLAEQSLDPETFADSLVDKSQGNFMYLRHVLSAIEKGDYRGRAYDELPVGLDNYYEDHWSRMRARDEGEWFDRQLPVLVALTTVREPVSMDLIAKFSGIDERRKIRGVLRQWNEFLYCSEARSESGEAQKRYRLYHASFHDFIAAKDEIADERVDLRKSHQDIASALRDQFMNELS